MIDIVASIAECMCNQNALPNALKTKVDLDRYVRIISEVKPRMIVEVGTYQGGSALWFADVAGCPVLTVDIAPAIHADMLHKWAGRVRHLIGSSVAPDVVAKVYEIVGDESPVLVVLDSDHSAAHVSAEMDAYADLVTPGSYMVVEDGIARYAPWFGIEGSPMDATEAFLEKHGGEWENDEGIEGMFATTQHFGGWLRRFEREG